MRDELNLMELADQYLRGELSAADRAAFEERMRTSPELRELVADQRALHGGMERLALRADVSKAYRSYKLGKWLPWLGGGTCLAILIAVFSSMSKEDPNSPPSSTHVLALPQPVISLPDTTGSRITPLLMLIDPSRDTTMLSPSGILVDVPKGTFVDSTGKTVTSAVRVTMLEAFDATAIMKAGLSTMSGDTLLETGGMFYIDAQSNGSKVSIAANRSINILIPADGVPIGMKLYDGVISEGGIIDWKDPVELPRTLVPVDMATLDFYPPGYSMKLNEMGYHPDERSFKDSLYYTFECNARTPLTTEKKKAQEVTCGLSPIKVKAIWNDRFNGTSLATHAFEDRMRSIHSSCSNAVLDLYVNNLDEDLRTIDRKVAQLGHREFIAFAERNDGRVQLPEGSAVRLKEVYRDWSRSFEKAVNDARNAYWNRQEELNARIQRLTQTDQVSEATVRQQLLREETELNLRTVYARLGYSIPSSGPLIGSTVQQQNSLSATRTISPAVPLPPPPRTAFNASIRTLGWKNIDQVMSAAYTRQSTSVGDGRSAQQVMINYYPCIITVKDHDSYEDLRVYLIPQGIAGYQRMGKGLGDRYEEKLNGLLTYDLVVLGQKNGTSFFFEMQDLRSSTQLTVSLQSITENQLLDKLNRFDRVRGAGLLNVSNYMAMASADAPRQREVQSRIELQNILRPIIFPCAKQDTVRVRQVTPEVKEGAIFNGAPIEAFRSEFDTPPIFPGGERAMRQFIYDRLEIPAAAQRQGISGSVIVSFTVTETGIVQEVRAVSGPDDGCRSEAERVIGLMPNWTPAQKGNRPIQARMTVPVTFLPRMDRLN